MSPPATAVESCLRVKPTARAWAVVNGQLGRSSTRMGTGCDGRLDRFFPNESAVDAGAIRPAVDANRRLGLGPFHPTRAALSPNSTGTFPQLNGSGGRRSGRGRRA